MYDVRITYVCYMYGYLCGLTKEPRMRRIQIDLNEDTVEALTRIAHDHGHKLKPFLEYLLNLQAEQLPEPYAAPAQIPHTQPTTTPPARITPQATPQATPPAHVRDTAKDTAQGTEEEPAQEPPRRNAIQDARPEPPKREHRAWTPNKNLSAYSEEVEPGIFTDGKSFAIQAGPVGKQVPHFFQHLTEAEQFKEGA